MVDKIDKKNNIVISLESLSQDSVLTGLAERLNKDDVLELLEGFYAMKVGEALSTSDYNSLTKTEGIKELICLLKDTL